MSDILAGQMKRQMLAAIGRPVHDPGQKGRRLTVKYMTKSGAARMKMAKEPTENNS